MIDRWNSIPPFLALRTRYDRDSVINNTYCSKVVHLIALFASSVSVVLVFFVGTRVRHMFF